jgi:hypothetical protein
MKKMKKATIYIWIFTIVVSSIFISCKTSYYKKIKSENLEEIITLIESNFKITSPKSSIYISFQKPSQALGDVTYDYNSYKITQTGIVEGNGELPEKILAFCERNKIRSIAIVYMNDLAQRPHYVMIFERQAVGLSRNKTIVYFKEERFYFPGQIKDEFISDKIYLITTHMDIM